MTLNNIAGGIAGGLGGLGALPMGFATLIASFSLMAIGHFAGAALGARKELAERADPRCIAALTFAALGISQLKDAVAGLSSKNQ